MNFDFATLGGQDAYVLLGIPADASPTDIRRARRVLQLEFHPDRQGGDAERSKLVNRAAEILLDTDVRRAYDAFRRGGAPGGSGGDPAHTTPADGGAWNDTAAGFHPPPTQQGWPGQPAPPPSAESQMPPAAPQWPPVPPPAMPPPMPIPPMPAPYRLAGQSGTSVPVGVIIAIVLVVLVVAVCGGCMLLPMLASGNGGATT